MADHTSGASALPCLVPITDPADPRIAEYRDVRERDLVGRAGRFIAEGEIVVRRLLSGGRHRALSLLLAEKRVAGLADALEGLADDVPVCVAGQAVMDAIVGFHIHRGILALGEAAPPETPGALLARVAPGEAPALVVVLVGLANHDNVGGVFRNAAALGADAAILDSECCDPLYRKATRVSVGATLTLPFARLPRGADPLAPLLAAGFTPLALTPDGGAPLSRAERPARAALVLGAEGPGLDPALIVRCRPVTIGMAGLDSLNVATASGIALYHFSKVR